MARPDNNLTKQEFGFALVTICHIWSLLKFRRLFALFAVSLLVGGLVFWSDIGLLFFGRCDATAWGGSRDVPTPPPAPGRHTARVVETRRIVPSDGLPPAVDVKRSNNNLDVTRFGGRTYLAFR